MKELAGSENRYSQDDEISLVDIIKIIIKRKWLFLSVFVPVIVFFSAVAIWKVRSQTIGEKQAVYTTYLSVGYIAANVPLEPLVSVQLSIMEIYAKQAGNKYPVIIEHNSNSMGNFMKLVTIVPYSEADDEKIRDYHSSVLKPLLARHNELINSINKKMARVWNTYILPTTVVDLAQKAVIIPPAPTKMQNSKTFVIGFVLGIVLGLISVFGMEFLQKIKLELKK